MISLAVNGKNYKVDVSEDMTLLWVLRDHLKLTGTKFSCGIGECGACTVLVNEISVNSCLYPAFEVDGKSVTTIEGLVGEGGKPLRPPLCWAASN